MSNLHAGKRKINLSRNKKLLNDKIKPAVVRNGEGTPGEDIPASSKSFLGGNLADLLFGTKTLARSSANTASARIKEARITKLIALPGRCHNLPGSHFRKITAVFIKDTFKSLHVPPAELQGDRGLVAKNVTKRSVDIIKLRYGVFQAKDYQSNQISIQYN